MAETVVRIRETLESVRDRSFGNDELAALAGPGWDEYHLGGGGANVVRPLGDVAGQRVLVLGTGSGVLVRYAADAGAQVVGVEPDADWLAVSLARTSDCEGVELVSTLSDADGEAFDLVLIVASPEQSPVPELGYLLGVATSRLADSGVVAVAAPNAVSVAQLSGFDSPDLRGVSTGISRPALLAAFNAAGLNVGVTLACYPDIFTSAVILSDEAFLGEEAVAFVDQLVGAPASGNIGRPFVLADDRAVLRALVESGVGPATAPGLLAIGARGVHEVEQRLGEQTLAWRFTGGRRRSLQQQFVVRSSPGGPVVSRQLVDDAADREPSGWLRHCIAPEQPYLLGENLEQQALAAMAEDDTAALGVALSRWAAELQAVAGDRPDVPSHPFLGAAALTVLPPDHVDVGLDNFAESAGGLVFFDREWRAEGGVEFDLVATRAVWKLAISTIRNGSRHPWRRDATVSEVWAELMAVAPFEVGPDGLERWFLAEGELLAVVTGADPAATVRQLRNVAARSRVDRAVYPAGVEASAAVHELDRQIERLTDQLTTAYARMADIEEESAAMSERLEELRGMPLVRIGRRVKRFLRR